MARFIARGCLLRLAFFASVGVFTFACLTGTAAFAQRGGHVGGGGRVGSARIAPPRIIPPRVTPPRVIPPRLFPRRLIYPIRPFFPYGAPAIGFWEGPYFDFGLGLVPGPIWGPNCGLYGRYDCNPLGPYYVFGEEERQLPQLFLTDGTVYNVTDYWLVDKQFHFKTLEEGGNKVVEHTIDFGQLDLQKTVDANTQRGFRFVLRAEPIDQYLRDHPDGDELVPLPGNPPGGPSQASPAPWQPQ